jgi:quercetin dioxygenase-like cupin family protein
MLTVEDHTPQQTQTESIWSLGALMTLKTRSPELEVVEAVLRPGVSPPLHQHDFGSESFYVIEGRMRVRVGDSELTIGPGEIARIPASTPHSFLTVEHTRVLDIIAPAGLWDFFVECGRPAPELRAPDGPELPGNLPEIVGRYRGRVLGPPPAWS